MKRWRSLTAEGWTTFIKAGLRKLRGILLISAVHNTQIAVNMQAQISQRIPRESGLQ